MDERPERQVNFLFWDKRNTGPSGLAARRHRKFVFFLA